MSDETDGLVEILASSLDEGSQCLSMMCTFPTTAPPCEWTAGARHTLHHQAAAVRAWLDGVMPLAYETPGDEARKCYNAALVNVRIALGLEAEEEKA